MLIIHFKVFIGDTDDMLIFLCIPSLKCIFSKEKTKNSCAHVYTYKNQSCLCTKYVKFPEIIEHIVQSMFNAHFSLQFLIARKIIPLQNVSQYHDAVSENVVLKLQNMKIFFFPNST